MPSRMPFARIGGHTEIPVESLRMKGIRDGMEDYELLALAAKLGLGAQAKQIAAGVYPKTYLATTSAAALDDARAQLAGLILHALGKDKPAPQPDPSPAPQPGPAPAPAPQPSPAPAPAPAPQPVSPLPQKTAVFPHSGGGCSTGGAQGAALLLPLLALMALRRRRG